MPYFRSPKILFGKGMLKRLGQEISGLGEKAMIITGRTMAQHCQPLSDALQEAGYQVKVWGQAEPEPSTQGALAAGQALSEFGPHLVVGFGGGSALDTAKAAWLLYAHPDQMKEDFWKAFTPKSQLNLQAKARFLAVPTTSGSGSDVGWALVLTDKAKNRKIAVANNALVPDWTLLAPEFSQGMPPGLTASTGLDVLGHAFDGYTARQQTDFSDGLCLMAIALCLQWLPQAYKDGQDLQAREKMQNAASIAGLGFGNSNTSLSHALAHALGVTFGLPHGRAVGLSLVPSLEYLTATPPLEGAPDPKARLATVASFVGVRTADDKAAIAELLLQLDALRVDIGEPGSLEDLNISQEDLEDKLPILTALASKDVNIYSCPCPVEEEQMKGLFRRIWSGK